MRKLKDNKDGSAIPLILFALTLISCGALYTLFFVDTALPTLSDYIPASDAKTFITMGIYSIPIVITLVGVISLLKSGLKQNYYYDGGG